MARSNRSTILRRKSRKSRKSGISSRLAMATIAVAGLTTIAAMALYSSRNLDLKCGVEGCHLQVNGGEKK